jgi:UDP-glucose:(heptosyl)LPS alpha-1,3-glucosyltransferase
VTVYAQEFEDDGLESVSRRRIPVRGPGALRLVTFSRDVRRVLNREHDHVVSFGASSLGADILWVNSVHAAWLEQRDRVPGDLLRSTPLRRFLPHHQVILAMERRYFTRSTGALAITVSDCVADDISRLYGFPKERSLVVHNGFDPAEFGRTRSGTRERVREELGVPPNAILLLLVANELGRKGLAVLLRAVAELQNPEVHVLLVGRADPTTYSHLIRELGLHDRFHYGGSRTDMGSIHHAADLFVLPTRYEAFCLAIVEALASGVPVITTDVPGARDLILDGVNGRLQRDPTSHGELATLLREALREEQFKTWAANAAASVEDHTWPRLLDRALEAIAASPSREKEAGHA